jgi:hypothetical protein
MVPMASRRQLAPADGGQVPGLQLLPAVAIIRPMVTVVDSKCAARTWRGHWRLHGQRHVGRLARDEAVASCPCMQKCQFQVCNVTVLFSILNSVISAQLFPHKDMVLLLFPQKDKQCSSPKRKSDAAVLANFKETKQE